MLVARLSFRPELAAEREVLMVSSSAGMVLVSNRQGTVPFSFSSSIWRGQSQDWAGGAPGGLESFFTNPLFPTYKRGLGEQRKDRSRINNFSKGVLATGLAATP